MQQKKSETRKMFLIDAYGTKDDAYLMFLDIETGEIVWKMLPRCYYVLRRVSDTSKISEKDLSDIWKYRKGYTYEMNEKNETESVFEVIRCNPSGEQGLLKNIMKNSQVYETQRDNLLQSLREGGIELYRNYDVPIHAETVYTKGSLEEMFKQDENDIDEDDVFGFTPQIITPHEIDPFARSTQLSHATIGIKVNPSNHYMQIPRVDTLHCFALKRNKTFLELFACQTIALIKFQFRVWRKDGWEIESASFDKGTNPTRAEFKSKRCTDDYGIIVAFLNTFERINPDVVQIHNAKIHYLYQRCVWYGEKKYDTELQYRFLKVMNRTESRTKGMSFGPQITSANLMDFCFPLVKAASKYKNPANGEERTTRAFLDYGDFSKCSHKYSFQNALLGRILVNYSLFDGNEFGVSPMDIEKIDKNIMDNGYLDLLLDMTGVELYLPSRFYNSNLVQCFNLIKKYNPDVFFPHGTKYNSKVKFNGGSRFESKFKLHQAKGDEKILMIDFESYYTEMFVGTNASPDVQTNLKTPNAIIVQYDNNPNALIAFRSPTERVGAIPNTIKKLLAERKECKHQIQILSNHVEQENVWSLIDQRKVDAELERSLMHWKIKERIKKLYGNKIFGCTGCQVGTATNPLAYGKIPAAITFNGRKYWVELCEDLQELSSELKSVCEILFGDTDGMIVKTEFEKEEIQKILGEFQKKNGGHLRPVIKEEFSAIITVNEKSWVGLEMVKNQESDLIEEKFINKGVITKIRPLLHRKMQEELMTFVMKESDVTMKNFTTAVKNELGRYAKDDLSFLDLRNQFKASIENVKKQDYDRASDKIQAMSFDVGMLVFDRSQVSELRDELSSIFSDWRAGFNWK